MGNRGTESAWSLTHLRTTSEESLPAWSVSCAVVSKVFGHEDFYFNINVAKPTLTKFNLATCHIIPLCMNTVVTA